jgi:phage-related protein
MSPNDKPLVWFAGEVRTPPFTQASRIEAGFLLRRLQHGVVLSMPHSRSMPSVGPRCHELRIRDETVTWRIMYRVDDDAIVVIEVFKKKTGATSKAVLDRCRRRLADYDRVDPD